MLEQAAPSGHFTVGEVVEAIHSFLNHKEKKSGDLDFKKGQLIRILETSAGHWWLGELVDGGAKGIFPISFVSKPVSGGVP